MAKPGLLLATGMVVLVVSRPTWSQLKPDDRPELREAVVETNHRLQKPRCRALFGANGADLFHSAAYILISFGKPRLSSNGKFNVISASTDRS